MFQRATAIAQLAVLAVILALNASFLSRLDEPVEIRLPATDILLLRQAIGPEGQVGFIGEQITIGKDGKIISRHGK